MRKKIAIPLGVAAAGLAGLGYAAAVEPNLYRVRRFDLPVLEPGSEPIRILQVSDIHMVPGQHRKRAWLRSLAELEPDLVVNTGDNLSHPDGVDYVLDALEPLLELPGVFVFGSNDYYLAKKLNPTKYLRKGDRSHAPRRARAENDWPRLQEGLEKNGWTGLNNARASLTLPGRRTLAFVGLDDPHVQRDRYDLVAGGPDVDAELTLGVTHAPYLRALDAMAADGLPVILAGHTHGGQLCIPGYGALVTNCDLDTGRVKGLHTHTAPNARTSYLHVSAGCGASRYAPVRFACPPEASLLTLIPRR